MEVTSAALIGVAQYQLVIEVPLAASKSMTVLMVICSTHGHWDVVLGKRAKCLARFQLQHRNQST
jgi:hypothetical protein